MTNKAAKPDVYERITNQIIAALEKGVAPWTCPWVRKGPHRNMVTGHRYRGINTLITWIAAYDAGYESNEWLTFKQCDELGGVVRKGEKATVLLAFNLIKLDKDGNRLPDKTPDELVDKIVPFARGISVFNRDQCDRLPEPEELSEIDVSFDEAEKLIENYGIEVVIGGDKACYSSLTDKISLPEPGRFKTDDARSHYWATAFHELVHSTGHESRLNRPLANGFGTPEYAKEELIAELGAAFLCGEFGLPGELQHADYIGNWLEVLNNDKKFVVQAASKAQEASDFLLAFLDAKKKEVA